MVRALEDGSTRWLVLACVAGRLRVPRRRCCRRCSCCPRSGSCTCSPAPTRLGRRIRQLTLAVRRVARVGGMVGRDRGALAEVVTPVHRRLADTTAFWNSIFGYNGFGRLTGNETGSVGGGGQGTAGRWGPTGSTRMFNTEFGGQISWLLPAALILLVAGLVFAGARRAPTARAPRSSCGAAGSRHRRSVFSLGKGIIHQYYTVALAPAIGALVGIGAAAMWRRRQRRPPAACSRRRWSVTAIWSFVLLGRTPAWNPWLRRSCCSAAWPGAILLVRPRLARALRRRHGRRRRRHQCSPRPRPTRSRRRARRTPARSPRPDPREHGGPGGPGGGFAGGAGGATTGGLPPGFAGQAPAARPTDGGGVAAAASVGCSTAARRAPNS